MLEEELDVALRAVGQACRLCAGARRALVRGEVLDKQDKSPVTVADFGSQAVVCMALSEAFPEDPIVAEEGSAELRKAVNEGLLRRITSCVSDVLGVSAGERGRVLKAIDKGSASCTVGRFWTLDPIDGTKGFLRNDQYAVALALIENGEVVLGVLGCPNLLVDPKASSGETGCLFYATTGQGASMRPLQGGSARTVQVAQIARSSEATFCEPFESGHSSHDGSAAVASRLGIVNPPVRMDSQCKYAAVARGDASIYMRLPTRPGYEEKIWDHAAGAIVIREAGGRVTDIRGRSLDFTQGRTLRENRGILATNGRLHDAVLEALAS